MAPVLVTLLEIYTVVLLARSIMSWVRPDPRGLPGQINEVLIRITEPVVAPVRRLLPSTGPFDLSVLIVLVLINVVLVPIAANL